MEHNTNNIPTKDQTQKLAPKLQIALDDNGWFQQYIHCLTVKTIIARILNGGKWNQ